MNTGFQLFPLKNHPHRTEKQIVDTLLAVKAGTDVDYPADLLQNRRIVFVSQIDKTKKVGQVPARPTDS